MPSIIIGNTSTHLSVSGYLIAVLFVDENVDENIQKPTAYQEAIRRQLQNEDTLHIGIEEINNMITETINRGN